MRSNEPNEWSILRAELESRCAGLAASEWVDDAIQDACLALLTARAAGVVIRDEVLWCVVVARRRLVDAHRRRLREVARAELGNVPAATALEIDWGRVLRDAGFQVSDEVCKTNQICP